MKEDKYKKERYKTIKDKAKKAGKAYITGRHIRYKNENKKVKNKKEDKL